MVENCTWLNKEPIKWRKLMKKTKMILSGLLLLLAGNTFAVELPSFIENTKIKGDFRFRYEDKTETGKEDRSRERIRFRLDFDTMLNDKFSVGFGLATGGDDPRSTNQTLSDVFSTSDIRLNFGYFEYKPLDGFKIWGGKYKGIGKALFAPTDLLWDSDITPEGIGFIADKKLNDNVTLIFNGGMWVLDEYSSTQNDPSMVVLQPVLKFNLDKSSFTLAVAYYNFSDVKGNSFNFSSGSNTLTDEGVLMYDYSTLALSMEYKYKVEATNVDYLALFGEYSSNSDVDQNDTGYIFGVKLGKKIKVLGDWELKVNYRSLEKDAWLDVFPDSDAFSGKTDAEGFEAELKIGLAKNTYLSIDYYKMDRISSESSQDLIQIDLNFKF